MFLITHDVRTDTMLMGWVVLGIWQLSSWYKSGRWVHLLMASLAIGGGMMTKGPIALMVPVFAFVPHLLLQRAWKQLLRWEYLVMALVIGVLLIPMSVGLYRQYDLHPEKVLYGQRGTSGLRFFYWTQSFGRITGESTWHENDSFFFLFENMLWGFLPWIVFFIWGLLRGVSNLIRDRFRITPAQEWISMGGFLVTYCALGVSRFQLPHYIYVVFPLVAIIAGRVVHDLCYCEVSRKWEMRMFKFHAGLFGLMALAVFVLLIVPFPPVNKVLIAAALGSLLFLVLILVKGSLPLPRLLVLGVSAILFINVFVDLGFYRPLLEYQMSVPVSRWIQAQHLDMDHFFVYKTDEERSMHFYSNHFFVHVTNPDSLNHLDYVLTSQQGMDSLNKDLFRVIYQGENFHVTGLSLSFLNPATRRKETTPYYVLQRK